MTPRQQRYLSKILKDEFLDVQQEKLTEDFAPLEQFTYRAEAIIKTLEAIGCYTTSAECRNILKTW